MNDIQTLNASIIALKHSIDTLIDTLRPSLKSVPDATHGAATYFDPELAQAADALRAELALSGYSIDQIENMIEKYLHTDANIVYAPERT